MRDNIMDNMYLYYIKIYIINILIFLNLFNYIINYLYINNQ